ncbi:hypothetical protein ACOMHN_048174 [Nucella lapillus]
MTNWADPLVVSRSTVFCRLASLHSGMGCVSGVAIVSGKLVPFLEHAVVHASTLIILSITVERYYAICRPLRKLAVCHKPRPLRVLPLVWATAVITATPFIVMTELHDTQFYDGSPCQVCGTSVQADWHYVYILGISLCFFALPLLLLLTLYFRIIRALRTSGCALRTGQVRDASVLSSHRSRKQVVKMLVGIVVLFFVSLLPVRCVILWQVFTPETTIRGLGPERYYNIMWISRLLIYINSAGNPVIYSLISSSFQQAFWRLLTGARHLPQGLSHRGSQSSHRGSVSRWSVTGVQRGGVGHTPGSSVRLLSLDSPSSTGHQGHQGHQSPQGHQGHQEGSRGGSPQTGRLQGHQEGSRGGSPQTGRLQGHQEGSRGGSPQTGRLSSLTTCASSPLVKKGVVCSVPLRGRSCTTIL